MRRKSEFYEYLIKMVGECEICSKTDNLVVHHIKRLSADGQDVPRNIMIVCTDCHKNIHFKEFNRK